MKGQFSIEVWFKHGIWTKLLISKLWKVWRIAKEFLKMMIEDNIFHVPKKYNET